jgi:hypothetical protein
MGKCITDAFGKVKHWVLSDNDFVYEYSNYERDAYTGRYYRLTESTSLKPEMDGALVKRRISKSVYESCLKEAKKACM